MSSSVKSSDKVAENTKDNVRDTEAASSPVSAEEVEEDEDSLDLLDMATFDQLLDMDDEEDHEFSKSIVWDYFKQAEATFEDMDGALEMKDLSELSRLGHFLKGSSAAIGLKMVKATCEKIQNIGNLKDETGISTIDSDEAMKLITPLLPLVKKEYKQAKSHLETFYEEQETR
ncbi:Phosphorelay intermediate protein [Umbelopsis nana]